MPLIEEKRLEYELVFIVRLNLNVQAFFTNKGIVNIIVISRQGRFTNRMEILVQDNKRNRFPDGTLVDVNLAVREFGYPVIHIAVLVEINASVRQVLDIVTVYFVRR